MDWFDRLPGSRRWPAGREWRVLKRLPAQLLAGTLLLASLAALLQSSLFELGDKARLEAIYVVFGLLLLHSMSVLTTAILCAIIVVMKGHAYVADAYALPDSEVPAQQ